MAARDRRNTGLAMERKAVALLGKAFGFWERAWHQKILYRDARTPVGVQRPDALETKASYGSVRRRESRSQSPVLDGRRSSGPTRSPCRSHTSSASEGSIFYRFPPHLTRPPDTYS